MYIKKAASILLVAVMLYIGALLNNMEIIFPEISALALGAWVMEISPWHSRRLNLWLSPTLAALTGMALLNLFPYRPFLMIIAALVLVIFELRLLRSDIFPAISAAILPIIVHAQGWFYPIAVCVLTAVIFIGKVLFEAFQFPRGEEPLEFVESTQSVGLSVGCIQPAGMEGPGTAYWVRTFLTVILVAAAAVGFDSIYILAPPLIVVFVELTQPKTSCCKNYFKVLLLTALAAFSGVFWLMITVQVLHFPFWTSAFFSMPWLFLLYRWTGVSLPPAAALTLLPVIVSPDKLLFYPFQVTLGGAIFVALAKVVDRHGSQEN